MSDHNNIYNIMGKLNALTPAQETKVESKPIYESVEAKGSVLEGVKAVEAKLTEKYMGFKAVEKAAKKGGAENPAAVAASIGRKKYGKTAFQKAAAAGKKMGEGEEMCDECGMYESHCECEHEHTNEERETLKTKGGTIYKGGKYGTEFDAGDDGEKKKKPKAKDGEKQGRGRPKKEKPAEYTGPKGDIFGRTTGDAPKGKKGTVVKGKANQDTVDESAPKGWEGTVKAMKKHKEIDNPYALAYSMKNKGYKSHVKESAMTASKALMESVNFRKMMDEADMTADEMLEAINSDIQAYKATGDMTSRLRDFMHLHNHMKKVEEEAASSLAPQMPTGQEVLPQQSTLGKIGSKIKSALTGPNDQELLARLQQDTQAPSTVDEELNELAKLAGITDEGNAFTGKLASTPKGGEFELDGKEFTDTSNLEESKKTGLTDIAKLAGIFQEGKDYGDTSFNEPPVYDNSPDECVQGVESQTEGGDGEVAGKEKAMKSDKPTWKNADNALAEDKALMKPAAEFNYVKAMGRDLMKAYEGIKTK
jgi:hypothetical protein